MKKLIAYFFTVGLLLSCSKNDLTQNSFKTIQINSQINDESNTKSLNNVSIQGVTNFENMLHFENFESYNNAKENLEKFQFQEIEKFNSIYLKYTMEELENLTENDMDNLSDELESISKEINFSETGIYAKFENKLNFTSLRSVISEKEAIFLNNPNPNWDEDPDNHFIVLTEERTLLNPNAEIKIGNSIYKFTEQYLYEITDGSYETLTEIRNSGYNNKMTNVVVTDFGGSETSTKSTSGSCKQTRSKSDFKYSGTKRIKWTIKINSWWSNKAVAITVNYKKRGAGWIKYKTGSTAAVSGWSCQNENYSPTNYTYSFAKSVTHKETVNNESFQNGYLQGYHTGAVSYTSTLTW